MFRNTYQNGLLSIFYSCGSNPLAIWDLEVKNGHIKRLTDSEVNSIVLEIITILDDRNMRRRFRISNFQSTTKIKPFCTSMPIGLAGGWNQIQFNLADFTRRAYGTQFTETLRVQVHANARLRRIYFSEKLYTEEELPQEYKLYLPLERKHKKGKDKKEAEVPTVAVAAAAAEVAPGDAAPTPAEVELSAKSQKSQIAAKKSMVAGAPTSHEKVEGTEQVAALSEAEAEAGTEFKEAVEGETTVEPETEGGALDVGEGPAKGEQSTEGEVLDEGERTTEGEKPAEGGGEQPIEGEGPAEEKAPAEDQEPAESTEGEAKTAGGTEPTEGEQVEAGE